MNSLAFDEDEHFVLLVLSKLELVVCLSLGCFDKVVLTYSTEAVSRALSMGSAEVALCGVNIE